MKEWHYGLIIKITSNELYLSLTSYNSGTVPIISVEFIKSRYRISAFYLYTQ